MPDQYWTKIGEDSKKPKLKFKPRTIQAPVPAAEEISDGYEAYWCPACKAIQKEKKASKLHAVKVRCRSCGLTIYPKDQKTSVAGPERLCKVCSARLRRGNSSHYCALCDSQRESRRHR